MSAARKAHRLNVVGDFYVVDECCTMCGVPTVEAPDLFGLESPDGTEEKAEHCYVKKQPSTAAELGRMIAAIQVAELGCIRYRGDDQKIIEKLLVSREIEQWDGPPKSRSN